MFILSQSCQGSIAMVGINTLSSRQALLNTQTFTDDLLTFTRSLRLPLLSLSIMSKRALISSSWAPSLVPAIAINVNVNVNVAGA